MAGIRDLKIEMELTDDEKAIVREQLQKQGDSFYKNGGKIDPYGLLNDELKAKAKEAAEEWAKDPDFSWNKKDGDEKLRNFSWNEKDEEEELRKNVRERIANGKALSNLYVGLTTSETDGLKKIIREEWSNSLRK